MNRGDFFQKIRNNDITRVFHGQKRGKNNKKASLQGKVALQNRK
jgi:hypothetical protein